MASRRRAREPAVEWSCPLCTLLNHWRDRRCAACDQERETQPTNDGDNDIGSEDDQEQQSVNSATSQVASSGAAGVGSIVSTVLAPVRTLRGVFFSSASTAAAITADMSNWRQEPRLKVNRRKRPLALKAPAVTFQQDTSQLSALGESQSTESQVPSFSLLGSFGATAAAAADTAYAYDDVQSSDNSSEQVVQQEPQQVNQSVPVVPPEQQRYVPPPHDDEPSTHDSMMLDEEDASQPCFQLLGPNTAMFSVAATPVDEPDLPLPAKNSNSIRDIPYRETTAAAEYEPPSFSMIDVCSPPPRLRPPPAAAADRLRRSVEPITPVVPKSILQQGFVAASRIPIAEDDNVVEAKLAQAGLDLSDSEDENNNSSSRLSRTKLRRNRIGSPEPAADDEEEEDENKAPVDSGRGTWECAICTNFNSYALARCELCDTKREDDMVDFAETSNNNDSNDNESDQYIDLAISQEEEADAALAANDAVNYYGFDPRDFENPYEQIPPDFPAYDEYSGADIGGAGYDDYVEDISDHEAPTMAYSGPPRVRTDLKEFEHFVCVEDLASDYGCRIDYRQMFGESKRGKVYADRIQTRKRASQKRKRAQDANGGEPPARAPKKKRGAAKAGAGGSGKPQKGRQKAAAYASGKARAGKKRKSAASAASGGATTGRGKAGSRRASASAIGTYSGINHYDTSGADFGDGVNTMAWEGVGSAGYF